jgi:hypothetical protein
VEVKLKQDNNLTLKKRDERETHAKTRCSHTQDGGLEDWMDEDMCWYS